MSNFKSAQGFKIYPKRHIIQSEIKKKHYGNDLETKEMTCFALLTVYVAAIYYMIKYGCIEKVFEISELRKSSDTGKLAVRDKSYL